MPTSYITADTVKLFCGNCKAFHRLAQCRIDSESKDIVSYSCPKDGAVLLVCDNIPASRVEVCEYSTDWMDATTE